MLFDKMEDFWNVMSMFFTIIGIIAMLIISVKTSNFITAKLVQVGNAITKVNKHENGKIISLSGEIYAIVDEEGKAESMTIPQRIFDSKIFDPKIFG